MCDDDIHQGLIEDPAVSRRTFGLIAAAGVAGAAGAAKAAANVVEKDVVVRTADGSSDAVLFHPAGSGSWPAVLIWPDILGLRPVFREMGRRLAGEGYVVLVPNPFYRSRKAPVVDGAFDVSKPDDRAKVFGLRAQMTDAGIDADSRAYLAFLDGQPQTAKGKKAGVQGYCMGGPLSFRTAAAVPRRIGAVGSFHGGGLVTKEANSPHLLIAKSNARYLVAIARNDDMNDPEAKNVLRRTFNETGKPATVEVYPANHGWCVRDNNVYNEAAAERAWKELTSVYKTSLV